MKKLLLLGIMTIIFSCNGQVKDSVNLNILNQSYKLLTKNKELYNLKYHSYSDTLHTRIVLAEDNIKTEWQPFTNGVILDYFDLYFNQSNKIIGFKGWLVKNSKDITENHYKSILDLFDNKSNYSRVRLNNKDGNFIENEWESKDYIIGIQYDKLNQSLCFILINKDEIENFHAEVFYTEFLNLTKNRIENIIKLPKLNYSSSDSDKNFYKQKFNELKNGNH